MALDVELAEIRDFLAQHAPFDRLPAEVLATLPRRLTVQYFRRGRTLIAKGRDNHHLFVLRSGAIDIHDEDGALIDRCEVGDTVGSISLVLGNPSTHDVTAIEDSLVLALPEADFRALAAAHPEFETFFDLQRAHRMRSAVTRLQDSETSSAMLKTSVRALIHREPITITSAATIQDAALVMRERKVSSILVVDDERLVGILTDRDLRNRVVAEGVDPASSVAAVMTPGPVTGDVDQLAFEAVLEMVARNIHHLPILERGHPVGVITTTDLMRMVQASPIYLVGEVQKQEDIAGVARSAARLSAMVESLVDQDATAEDIGRVVTAIGDAIERRVLDLVIADIGPAPVPYAWVALGSRARLEQALAADQDHALIIADEATAADLPWFETLAQRVTAALVQCGYAECAGDVMATNPRWRRRLRDWREEFARWLDQPTPDAILGASIFFDMRATHGDETLCATLRREVIARAPESRRFLAHLARAATLNEPPLTFFRGFVLAKEGEHAATLDIKRGGVGAVVELARVEALAAGSPALNTVARLTAAVSAGLIGEERGADLKDAFEFISYVRIRHQAQQSRAGRPVDNRVNPSQLSSFDKRALREAFGIVRGAQSSLVSMFPAGLG